ncbi:caspase family protein [Candidatus Poribacteria bacterium]|nr:caspase family protein [Candidatus Poribacteria bacterium]
MFTKTCQSILLLSILLNLMFNHVSAVSAEKWALLIGINDYKIIGPDLRFCESDAGRMKEALIKSAGFNEANIKLLLGTEATKSGIRKAMKDWLIANVKPGDTALFYFSGHGIQIPDPTGQEEDGKDELLCAYDSALYSYTFVRDNELGEWLDEIQTDQKIVMLDCCHSGTATRSLVGFGEQSQNVPLIKAYYPPPGFDIRESTIDEIKAIDPDITAAELSRARGIGGDTGGETAIAGCRDDQVALESPAVKGGVLTTYLIESMNAPQTDANGDGVVSIHELWEETQKRIRKGGWQQDPQYYGNESAALVGAHAEENLPKPNPGISESGTAGGDSHGKVTQVSGDSVQLSIGSDDGVTRGSIYAVKDPSGTPKAQLRITHVEPSTASAQPIENRQAIQVGDSVMEERHFVESEDLLLLVEPLKAKDKDAETLAAQLTAEIEQQVKQLPNVKLVDATQAPDRILAGTVASAGALFEVSLRLINVNIGNSTAEHSLKIPTNQVKTAVKTLFSDQQIRDKTGEMKRIEGFATLLRASYMLKALARLENPKPDFRLHVTLDKGDLATYNPGETVKISLRPERDCYVYVLDIGSSDKITLLFPSEFEPDNFLKRGSPGYTLPSTDAYAIEVSEPPGEERIKVIATTQKLPIDQL